AATGTISASGLYVAPEFPPANNAITITAQVSSNSKKSGSANITLLNPIPQITTASPTSFAVGTITVNITGLHFAPGAVVYLGTTALVTTRTSSTQLTATGTATLSQVGSINIVVTNPAPGSPTSSSIAALITKTGTVVDVAPATASVRSASLPRTVSTPHRRSSRIQTAFRSPPSAWPTTPPPATRQLRSRIHWLFSVTSIRFPSRSAAPQSLSTALRFSTER